MTLPEPQGEEQPGGSREGRTADRRAAQWEIGLRYRPGGYQQPLQLPVGQDMAQLPLQTEWEVMADEYATLSLYPQGHLMSLVRPSLNPRVKNSQEVQGLPEGAEVTVAGLVIRRQRPHARAVFITLEDELGHIPLVVWPQEYRRNGKLWRRNTPP